MPAGSLASLMLQGCHAGCPAIYVEPQFTFSDIIFDGERLQHTPLRPDLVDKPRNFDRLYKKQYGNIAIFARPWVIHQWLAGLIAVHPHYQSITVPQYPNLCHVINEANWCSCGS
jgi:hypothetical protein